MSDDDPFCVCGCRESEHCHAVDVVGDEVLTCCHYLTERNPEPPHQVASGGFCSGCDDCSGFEWPRNATAASICANIPRR